MVSEPELPRNSRKTKESKVKDMYTQIKPKRDEQKRDRDGERETKCNVQEQFSLGIVYSERLQRYGLLKTIKQREVTQFST